MCTIRASASPSAIAASLKPPPEKGIDDSHCKKTSGSRVQPERCTRIPASNDAKLIKILIRLPIANKFASVKEVGQISIILEVREIMLWKVKSL